MDLSIRYNPKETEDKWYAHWLERNYFHSEPDEREPYTIVIPPPNVTGVLHIGHMLDNTIQDILIRKARLDGKNACWVPGTDHASIATEAKLVASLRAEGLSKQDVGREAYLERAWAWKEKYGGIILDQLRKIGASCDWERTRFTMEPAMYRAVMRVFVDLHRKGKIYRGRRITNWDPEAQTVLSNEEVNYTEENSPLYYVRYRVEGSDDEWVTIATVRPETIPGDTAIAAHPDDDRFASLKGRRVIVPLVDRPVPVIFDDYVDPNFGTGMLKITPAHDMNDFEIGERHQLETVEVLNADGTMSEAAGVAVGMDRFEARREIVKALKEAGHIVRVENYRNKVGRSQRTDAIVEPRLTLQWFLDMKDFAATALAAVEKKEVRFFPPHFWNMFQSWLREENVRDWCISRQLWWGQRIPAWYLGDPYDEANTDIFVAETAEEALAQAREKTGDPGLTLEDLRQDDDVVDTWFSSWLWPITVFDGFERQDELAYYYPTSVLVTAWDIIFFWVSRMIMAGYEYAGELLGEEHVRKHGQQPFRHVYFHGMVRDHQRRKMSKSLGNSPDLLALLDHYGADSVRFGIMASGSAGNDIIFDAPFDPESGKVLNESKLCEQGRNFCNKMWNALRLVKGWAVSDEAPAEEDARIRALAGAWIEQKLDRILIDLQRQFEEYRLAEALMSLYKFIWDDFCSWYLEMIKPDYGKPIDRATLEHTIGIFERLMTALHPFMPFITEEVWHLLSDRAEGEDCIVSRYPSAKKADSGLIRDVERAKEVVTNIRDLRNTKGIKKKEALAVTIRESESARALFRREGLQTMIAKMANLRAIAFSAEEPVNAVSFISGTEKYYLSLDGGIDTEAECERLRKELAYHEGFVQSVQRKLGNEKFVANAPAPVVDKERKKLSDGQTKIRNLEEALAQLGCG